jgi:fructose-specific PTS system IIA-like component
MQSLTFTDIIARNPGYIGNIESEKARFSCRVRCITRRARGRTRKNQGIEHDLIAAHLSLITDIAFQDSAIGYLNNNMNAWSAIAQASLDFCHQLERSSSQYLQERALDILDIATQLISAIYGEQALAPPAFAK